MNRKEQISYFMELIHCEHDLHLWIYDSHFTLLETDCPSSLMHPDIISILGFSDLVLSHCKSGSHSPLILDTEFGLEWIAAFEYDSYGLVHIFLLGPVFSGRNPQILLRDKLDSYQISVELKHHILTQIEQVAIVPSSLLLSYTLMFHYTITGERITADLISYTSNPSQASPDVPSPENDNHPGVWMAEQTFLGMIRDGNPNYRKALGKSMTLSSGMKADIGDTLRSNKNNILVLLTLCSRASIEGGLNPSVAYSLNDYYAGRIEQCRSAADITNLSTEFLDDYVTRVRQSKETDEHSRQIQNICDYIHLHIREPLKISDLASHLGYTDYYFSHKFKEVTGSGINAYIRHEKIEEAKLLLTGTNLDIQTISEELSFGSRSYFFSCFQKETGISPTKYRQLHCNLSI